MALLTIHRHMLSYQRIVCNIMVEKVHGFQGQETGLLMTFGAILTVFAFMLILMTGHTLVFSDSLFIMKDRQWIGSFCVATKTIYCFVLPF